MRSLVWYYCLECACSYWEQKRGYAGLFLWAITTCTCWVPSVPHGYSVGRLHC